MNSPGFVHLHNHSDYSLLDGAQTIERMVSRAVEYGMPALALTDHGNMFGAVNFYDQAKKAGVKPIIGMEAYVTRGGRTDKTTKHGPQNPLDHLVLLAATPEGYRNLIRLSSSGFLEGFYYKPRIDYEILQRHSAGLIGLSACLNAEIPKLLLAGREDEALAAAGRFTDIFGRDRFFIELQDHDLPDEKTVMPLLVQLSKKAGVPLVATNDCHYNRKEDADAHDVLVCIQTGKSVDDPNRLRFTTSELYFKSAAEMRKLFRHYPEACDRTLHIAEMCSMNLDLGTSQLPHFPCPDGFPDLDQYLRHLAREGMARRYATPSDTIMARLDFELGVITQMGYEGYFLVVRDFIEHARSRGIPVGPGRGSAAGSLVAYCIGITDIDPIRFNLLFERFLNPERISMPDIDVDFEDERRDEIIQYVRQKYGEENVCQIITFGTMAARGAIRDVGRALGMKYGDVDRIAKLVPEELGITLDRAIETVPELREMENDPALFGRLLKTARTLEGLSRHASTHAAGVIIAPTRLDEIVPLFKPANKDEVSTQYDMNSVEKIGLVKMDFLGLRTLKVIDKAVKLIAKTTGERIDPSGLAFEDPPTMDLLRQAKAVGVFQFESEGMRNLLRRLGPDSFEDLIAVNALYRPGPMGSGMVDDFIDCKQGRKPIRYEHPLLEEILKPTYGMMVYQEQVMQIASKLAGFSLGQADLLRRAMGKKKAEEMAKQKEAFVTGAVERAIPTPKAEKIFEQMAFFAGYGFNKSHSAAYALISYQTAWLKAHYPIQFMAASLTSEMEKTNRIVTLVEECRKMAIPVLAPDVNASEIDFTVEGESIRFGMGAVKNVGFGAIEAILAARRGDTESGAAGGPFTSLFDFCRRVDLRSMNRRVVESLIAAGAFDSLPGDRARKTAAIGRAMEGAAAEQEERERGQFNLFGGGPSEGTAPTKLHEPELPVVPGWDRATLLREEKAVLGFYLSDHPLATLREEIAAVATVDSQSLMEKGDNVDVVFVGVISAIKKTPTRSGDLMAWLTLEDFAGSVECLCFPDLHETCKEILSADRIVIVQGRSSTRDDEDNVKIVATEIADFESRRATLTHTLHLSLAPATTDQVTLLRVRDILSRYPGKGSVIFHIDTPAGRVRIKSGDRRVAVSGDLLAELRALLGADKVRLAEARFQPAPPREPEGPGGFRNRGRRGAGRPSGDLSTAAARNYRKDPG
jgi:DNA polymerase-3 subunit alpha